MLFRVLEADATAAGTDLDALAQQRFDAVQSAVRQYREQLSERTPAKRAGLAAVELALALGLIAVLRAVHRRLRRSISESELRWLSSWRIQGLELLSREQQRTLLRGVVQVAYGLAVLVVASIFAVALASHFPQVDQLREAATSQVAAAVQTVGQAIIGYLPNLLIVSLAAAFATLVIRFSQLFFGAIDEGRIAFQGFDQDWAMPTHRILFLLVIALAFTLVFPYLPGSQAPAFRGVSILFGALVTLGGASAVSNIIGGVIIIYTRAFRIGDFIELGGYKGTVYEKTILSTRLRTLNNEMVTIPNATMLSGPITNFNSTLRELEEPVVLQAAITLGYDVPWRQAEAVLCAAANRVERILESPASFVRITSLDDFYVSYELKAFTDDMALVPSLSTQLHQAILDGCNEAGIEILSPHYAAVRDGNQITIPASHLPGDVRIPGFQVDIRKPPPSS
ncbi:mechanosensitive ion channel family protein [Synechococcus sp. RSCCF101]|uniref:mechanosensitive ion channel family protein n=1 Tax=Synechococcus sp. RSCCF101 TaxID=2511069 RepID=UPI001245441B|nr:mechanosensitive ion channel family protein [Synechococcus sp. RSCCF101]QEY32677.1 mechanosensitive ion channel family protein [Synechococcus sp. RSCCF101]